MIPTEQEIIDDYRKDNGGCWLFTAIILAGIFWLALDIIIELIKAL